jgi:ketosteroid isomerase-like protein
VPGERACGVLRSVSRERGSGIPVEARYAHVWTLRSGRGVRVDAFYDVG